MGLYLKDALDMGAQYPSNLNDGIISSQEDLRELLTKIWNNQDNLTKEDIKTLEYLAKK
jgi:predicted transcriptional regulator